MKRYAFSSPPRPARLAHLTGSLVAMLAATAWLALALPRPVAARSVYVSSEYPPSKVTVIDTMTNGVLTTIQSGLGLYANTIAMTPDGSRAYVTNIGTDNVSVIDTSSNAVTQTIALPSLARPWLIAIAPDGGRAYIANHGGHGDGVTDSVSVIDTVANKMVGAPIPVGTDPTGVAVAPDGRRVYVANWGASTVSVIDTATTAVSTIDLGSGGDPKQCDDTADSCPIGISITPDGSRAYVANVAPDTVSVIDTATNSVIGSIQLPACTDPGLLAVSPDGRRVYVANTGSLAPPCGYAGSVSVIDTASNTTVGDPIPERFHPDGIAVTPDGGRIYVSNFSSDNVYAISTATNSVVAGPIKVGKGPQTVAIAPNQGPVASFAAGRAEAGSPVQFDASSSRDPDGTVARYDWDFGDGMSAPDGGPTPSHAYENPGAYGVALRVTDNEGVSTEKVSTGQAILRNGSAAARDTRTISVGPDATPPTVRVTRLRARARLKRRTFKRISGTATDASGVARVKYALGRESGLSRAARGRQNRGGRRRCRFLADRGMLRRKAVACKRPSYLKARGTTSWRVILKKVLSRGGYALFVRATDTKGNTSEPVKVPFRLG